MSVRAKFKVQSIKRTMGSMPKDGKYVPTEMWTLEMSPVYGNGDPEHENTKFWAASPSGSLVLSVVNKAAVDQFDLEQEYYIDFTRASK